jgi:hypothetical protein
MGDELLHSPTPIGQGPRRGAYIVGYYEVVAGVEVDRLRRRPNMGTSQNSVKAKFSLPWPRRPRTAGGVVVFSGVLCARTAGAAGSVLR